MKKGLIIGIIGAALLYLFSGCENNDHKDWDSGYESAWEGEEAPSAFWASKSKKDGYEQGEADAYAHDEGYYDGYNGHNPKYLQDYFYLHGYKDGKKDKSS